MIFSYNLLLSTFGTVSNSTQHTLGPKPKRTTIITMNPAITMISSINFEAVELLRRGSFHEAAQLLASGLKSLRGAIRNDSFTGDTGEGAAAEQGHQEPISPTTVKICQDEEDGGNDQASSHLALHEGPFELFDRAFVFQHDGVSEVLIGKSPENLKRMMSVLLYNMAVAYHLRGTRRGEVSQKHLKTSAKMYKMALQLIDDFEDGPVPGDLLIYMACLNNLGCVSGTFFEIDEVTAALQGVRTILEDCQFKTSQLDSEDFFHFSVTALIYDGCYGGMMAAPAA